MTSPWKIRGEFLLSCNCDVFCPCVISLGKARPTEGVCHGWLAVHVEEGQAGEENLDGRTAAVLLDVPGPLAEGGWTVGVYVDEGASPAAAAALSEILTGQAGGPPGWISIMVAHNLGTKRVPLTFENRSKGWQVSIPKTLEGGVEPVAGPGGGATRVTNTAYWVASEMDVCQGAPRSRFRDWGRNWNLTGKSAEHARIEWSGP